MHGWQNSIFFLHLLKFVTFLHSLKTICLSTKKVEFDGGLCFFCFRFSFPFEKMLGDEISLFIKKKWRHMHCLNEIKWTSQAIVFFLCQGISPFYPHTCKNNVVYIKKRVTLKSCYLVDFFSPKVSVLLLPSERSEQECSCKRVL